MADASANNDLREFLRTRRARVAPEDVGLPATTGRRVPGLRREEVAQLAGMSVDYYVRLERGRNPNVSESVLDAVARALQLSDLERGHLHALARPTRQRSRRPAAERVRPGLLRALESMPDVPAHILGPRMDVLAANPLARTLYTDWTARPVHDRNIVRFVFLDDRGRELFVDWTDAARGVVAALHLYAGRHPGDPRLAELVGELSVRDADFRRWWADHDVFRRTYGVKRYFHPLVGEFDLGYEAFTPVAEPEQTLGLHTVEPNSPNEEALRLLAGWTAQSGHVPTEAEMPS